MDTCDETLLNINKKHSETFSNCKNLKMKNTIQIDLYDINDKNIIINIQYPKLITEYMILNHLIKRLEKNIEGFEDILRDKLKNNMLDINFTDNIENKINNIPEIITNLSKIITYEEDNIMINLQNIDLPTLDKSLIITLITNLIYYSIIKYPVE